ncbi:BrnT family toxin [Edaphobacter bradus]|uniref:BrnT family toxin n=1 Tax=Edaphobacter bradus TaxID=2259016 RepID=UPI0021E090DA|nr:BrnT family toxin [Edaphobacter bradus]
MPGETERFDFEGTLFEWNRAKAASNLHKHGVSFGEAATVFGDEDGLLIGDPDHSEDESRFLLVGRSRLRRLLVVVLVERSERVRIISARRATLRERKAYEEGCQD